MRTLVTLIMLFAALAGFAQKKKKEKTPAPVEQAPVKPAETAVPAVAAKPDTARQFNPLIDHYLKKYTLATRWNDLVTAKDALYDLITETGSDSLAYTLAVYYYDNSQFASSALLSKDLLARKPKNVNLQQLCAASFESLGLKDKALPYYEAIFLETSNTAVLFKMANLQYDTKLYAESKANVDILLTKKDLDSLSVAVDVGQNKTKNYPARVSILNLKGLLAQQSGDKPLARKSWMDALAIAPDFATAKENLAKLK